MKTFRAVVTGILGALAMSGAMFLLRLGGFNVNLERLLGSMFDPASAQEAWLTGFAIHLAVGAIAGLAYAAVFEMAVQRAGPVVGAGLGLCHGLLAGLIMSGIPAMNPVSWGSLSAPGPFLQHLQFGPFLFLALHCIFGIVVGTAYGQPVQRPHAYTNPVR